jgi:BirA family biotin operon repressor/biotin-[acetyl-CoA-carboxylase] ligase
MLNQSRLKVGLPIEGLGEPLYMFSTIGSTNDEAKSLASQGAPHGTLVVADEQTSGRGRQDRKWYTAAGAGLALSVILRPESMTATMGTITVLGALAVTESLAQLGVKAWIKWPNDVIVEEGKLAGVLVEAGWLGDRIEYAVVGIGVNVRTSSIPEFRLDFPATCVDHVVGNRVDRHELLFNILRSLGFWYRQVGTDALIGAWESNLAYLHQDVRLQGEETSCVGKLEGLEADGRLRIGLEEGKTIQVSVGAISLRPIDIVLD